MTAQDSSAPTFHKDFALQHYLRTLKDGYRARLLLSFMWNCVNDPWQDSPEVFLSSSRLEVAIADRPSRCRALTKLVKIGALKKMSKPTKSGTKYRMCRPAIWELSTDLQAQLVDVSARDYRYNPAVDIKLDAAQTQPPKPVQLRPRAKVKRKDINEYMKLLTLGRQKIPVNWQLLAFMLEQICGFAKGTVSWKRGRKDVEALGAWLVTAKIKPSEMNKLFKLLRVERAERPSGNALRYAFEEDTPEKAEYLRCVLADLRPRLQAAKGDEP